MKKKIGIIFAIALICAFVGKVFCDLPTFSADAVTSFSATKSVKIESITIYPESGSVRIQYDVYIKETPDYKMTTTFDYTSSFSKSITAEALAAVQVREGIQ